jgi:hypothetical protein
MNLEDNENLKSHTSEKIREDLSFAALWTMSILKPFFEQLSEDKLHIISSRKIHKHQHYIQLI